jgi:hypothetical protein
MALRLGQGPTQGDEKHLLSINRSPRKRRPPLCHPERSREPALSEVEGDLRFRGPFLEMFFDRALAKEGQNRATTNSVAGEVVLDFVVAAGISNQTTTTTLGATMNNQSA